MSRMISTLPRSGTWRTKYLLVFLYRIAAGVGLDIASVYAHVRQLAASGTDTSRIEDFVYRGLTGGWPHVAVSHFICPGFLSLEDEVARTARRALAEMGALEFHLEVEAKLGSYRPDVGGKVCFVYRNPFSVFLSYARRFQDRHGLLEKKVIPFNPHWPISVGFQNETYEDPFQHYVANFRRSNFMEAYAVMAGSYVHMKVLHPNNVRIISFEALQANEMAETSQMLEFLGFHLASETAQAQLAEALAMVEKGRMRDYEAQLGHSLSGNTNYYGEEKRHHITVSPERPWKDILTEGDIAWAKSRVEGIYPGLSDSMD